MGHDRITMKFADSTFFNQGANNGLGEFQARFVIVHPGREQEAESILTAFHSAGGKGVRVRDGMVALGEKQIQTRIEQLNKLSGNEEVVGELHRGLQVVQRLEENRNAPKEAAPVVKAKATGATL